MMSIGPASMRIFEHAKMRRFKEFRVCWLGRPTITPVGSCSSSTGVKRTCHPTLESFSSYMVNRGQATEACSDTTIQLRGI